MGKKRAHRSGDFSFCTVRAFQPIPYFSIGKTRVPSVHLPCSIASVTFGFPSDSSGCLHAPLQAQVFKSQDHCPKPGQEATVLWLNGSRETACGDTASPAQRAEKPLLTVSHNTHALLEGTHERLPHSSPRHKAKARPRLGRCKRTRSWETALSVCFSQKDTKCAGKLRSSQQSQKREQRAEMRSCSELLLDTIAAVKKHQSRREPRPRASRNAPLRAGSAALAGKPAGPPRSEMYCRLASA